MFFNLNVKKIIIFLVLICFGVFSVWYAYGHMMDCFMLSVCQRPMIYYLIAPIVVVSILPVYYATGLISLILNPQETTQILYLTYFVIAVAYYYLLACVFYALWIKFIKRRQIGS
jgi:hypothetical protein